MRKWSPILKLGMSTFRGSITAPGRQAMALRSLICAVSIPPNRMESQSNPLDTLWVTELYDKWAADPANPCVLAYGTEYPSSDMTSPFQRQAYGAGGDPE